MSRKNNVRDGSGAPAAGDVLNGSAASAAHAGAEGRAVRQSRGSLIRKWSRAVHRDLSFFFAGVIIIYAVSGICLNHKREFNSNYSLKRYDIVLDGHFPMKAADTDRECLLSFVSQLPERESYTRHSATGETGVKIFFKGGSSLDIDLADGTAVYEKLRKRPVLGAFSRLHYNPSRWWTWFSDIFAVSLVLITVTGIIMLKGPKGLWGRGGIELIAGIIIPLLFIFI